MNRPTMPDREPDVVLRVSCLYWFEEMLHTDDNTDPIARYHIKFENDKMMWQDHSNGSWNLDEVEGVNEAYNNWLLEKLEQELTEAVNNGYT